jgi:hypothetical protein
LRLKCDEPLSNFAFNFNLRRYSKALVREVEIPSRFTHDAVRAGDRVFLADTGGGHGIELELPDPMQGPVNVLHSAEFTLTEHVNTLAPAGDPARPHLLWALLHNRGASKLVLADLATGERVREIKDVANKVGRCRLPVSKPVLKAPMVSALEAII